MSEPLDGSSIFTTDTTLNATVTVNRGGVTVDPRNSPFVVGTFNTEVVYAGNTTDVQGTVTTHTFTTYFVTFTQGDVTFDPTFTLPATFTESLVSVGPATVMPSGGTFVLTCVDQNTTHVPVVRKFDIPATFSDGTNLFVLSPPVDPTMIFNPPREE